MANTRKTMSTYRGTGTQKTFAFNFDYLQKSFIKVSINGNVLTYGIDYTVTNHQVDLLVAPVVDAIVIVYRETATSRLVSWEDASVLRAADMNLFEVQLLHIAEETQDKVQDSGMALDPDDNIWDARFHKIKNVSEPEKSDDVVTKRYFESVQTGYVQALTNLLSDTSGQAQVATTKAIEAANSASAANASETKAEASENAAKTSETNAKSSETAAKTSENNAKDSVIAAKTSETNAANSASQSATSASQSATSATEAYNYLQQTSNSAGYTKAQADARFSPAGLGYEQSAKLLTDLNLDNLITSGIYMGQNMTAFNGAWQSTDWFWVEVIRHNDNAVYQRLTAFGTPTNFIAGRSWARVKLNGTWQQWKELVSGVSVLTGAVGHGGTIPLPDGYTQDQCRWMVSTYDDNPYDQVWDIQESGANLHYRFQCYANSSRGVVCQAFHGTGGTYGTWVGSIANYIIIGVKY